MKRVPWDQRIARAIVPLIARTPVTPNHLTATGLVLAFVAAGLFASGHGILANWAAGVFVFSRFLDHFDGELARLKGVASRFGYYFDYLTGALSYAALFLGIGLGLSKGDLGSWATALGAAAMAAALITMGLDMHIDRFNAKLNGPKTAGERDAASYPGYGGFEIEDGIYLLAPITWLGFLTPFYVLACVGASIFCAWTLAVLVRLRRKGARDLAATPRN
ncbi:MAG: CDP-alcohol phosphatidyltransferase family protein [Rhodospirillales bacterium]|nr:CDP-alcohol phosphatidyltransferase family protein [Rhodospirillales bacterium]